MSVLFFLKRLAGRSIDGFDRFMQRYTPDPFVFTLVLTGIVFVAALVYTPCTWGSVIRYWGSGFWDLSTFTLHMAMILLLGSVLAMSRPCQALLTMAARWPGSPKQVILCVSFLSLLASWVNWGFGLVLSGLLCRHMACVHPQVNFRLMVASGYSGFLIWHGGLSGSIPLALATPGQWSHHAIGHLVPLEQTLFSWFNLCAVGGLCVLIPVCNVAMNALVGVETDARRPVFPGKETKEACGAKKDTEGGAMTKPFLSLLVGGGCFLYLFFRYIDGQGYDLNAINMGFLGLGLLLHYRPSAFMKAAFQAAGQLGPLLIQFPFYAGLASLLSHSGLGVSIAQWFATIATQQNYGLWTFYSAGLLNIAVPSGGGQWALQGPIVIAGAQAVGGSIPLAAMAVAWGDAWTNMIQPFWAVPLLSLVGLHIRDIMGYCLVLLLVSGVYLSCLFLLF